MKEGFFRWRVVFKSKPNRCFGCPLGGASMEAKAANKCAWTASNFNVRYKVDRRGRTTCIVKKFSCFI